MNTSISQNSSGKGSHHSIQGGGSALHTSLDDESTLTLINEMRGKVVEQAKTKQGSQHIQKLLDRASPELVEFIVVESLTSFSDLMIDSYGNFFCSKLLQSASSNQRLRIL